MTDIDIDMNGSGDDEDFGLTYVLQLREASLCQNKSKRPLTPYFGEKNIADFCEHVGVMGVLAAAPVYPQYKI